MYLSVLQVVDTKSEAFYYKFTSYVLSMNCKLKMSLLSFCEK